MNGADVRSHVLVIWSRFLCFLSHSSLLSYTHMMQAVIPDTHKLTPFFTSFLPSLSPMFSILPLILRLALLTHTDTPPTLKQYFVFEIDP